MKTMRLAGALLAIAAGLGAATLQDWSSLEDGKSGTYADEKGSSVAAAVVDGPAKGLHAVRVTSDLKEWGGMWAVAQVKDLSGASGLRFKAKADAGGILRLSLMDAKRVNTQAEILVKAGAWQEFSVPLGLFHRSPWQQPEVPKDLAFDAAHVGSLTLNPTPKGKSVFTVGPVETLTGKFEARTGLLDGSNGVLLVQDFESIESGFGTFQDDKTGCKMAMTVAADPDKKGNKAGAIEYKLAEGGWGGAWIRAGQAWGGQDWSAGKGLTLRIKGSAPVDVELAFNDANQNAYLAPAVHYDGKGWQTLSVPLAGFELNAYYQPPEAKKGAPLDLSHIESFNIGVKSPGQGRFLVDDVELLTK